MPAYDSNTSHNNLLESSFAKSVTNSAYRPCSPIIASSGNRFNTNFLLQNNTNYNDNHNNNNLNSLLVSNANTVMFKTLNANLLNNSGNSNLNFFSPDSFNNRKNSEMRSQLNTSGKLQMKPYKINFSKDLLLNNENWELICKWIDATDIFVNSIQPKLLYKATRDGFSYEEFQKRCCGIKNTLVIAKTNSEKIIGGFTPLVWDVPNEPYFYMEDPNMETFLFSVDLAEKYDLKPKQFAVCLSQKNGPIFGGGSDLEIVDGCDKQYNNCSNIGHSFNYSKKPEAFYGRGKYLVTEYEVYHII